MFDRHQMPNENVKNQIHFKIKPLFPLFYAVFRFGFDINSVLNNSKNQTIYFRRFDKK